MSVKAYFEESGARPFTCEADGAGQASFVLLSFVLLCPTMVHFLLRSSCPRSEMVKKLS